MRLNRCALGFSIIEALVAAIVFAIAAIGIFSALSKVQPTSMSLQAAYIGQQVLESLRSSVDAGTWNSGGAWSVGSHPCPAAIVVNWASACVYIVSPDDPVSKARQVTVNVNWPDS